MPRPGVCGTWRWSNQQQDSHGALRRISCGSVAWGGDTTASTSTATAGGEITKMTRTTFTSPNRVESKVNLRLNAGVLRLCKEAGGGRIIATEGVRYIGRRMWPVQVTPFRGRKGHRRICAGLWVWVVRRGGDGGLGMLCELSTGACNPGADWGPSTTFVRTYSSPPVPPGGHRQDHCAIQSAPCPCGARVIRQKGQKWAQGACWWSGVGAGGGGGRARAATPSH